MGSKCSAPSRDKIQKQEGNKPDQRNDEVSTIVKSGKKSSPYEKRLSQQEEGVACKKAKRQEGEETSVEKMDCSENNRTSGNSIIQDNTSPCHSCETHDLTPLSAEEREAKWVDKNRADLIQSVTSVMAIADQMYQQRLIHKEVYNNIQAGKTSMDQMRVLYSSLTYTKIKHSFYRILQEIEPAVCGTEDVDREAIKKHKADLRKKLSYEPDVIKMNPKDEKPLDRIYTELHIIQGESKHINEEHEIWEIQDKTRIQTAEGTKINCNDIFKSPPGENKTIRTVMTKGIAGIGKTVSVKKFVLDWADGKANQDIDFIFMLPFRELNLVENDGISLETLVREFHQELKNTAVARMFSTRKVLFIFDGLDETQLEMSFRTSKRLTDVTKKSSVDTLLTNLIRGNLLPDALVWITSRPGAVKRIPCELICQLTEVRGFNDPQKKQYFRKRVEDQTVAEKIIHYITMSRSLYIMCHIPIFCWMAAKVFEHLLLEVGNIHEENMKLPTTLTEMYTYFLISQMQVATDKYDKQNNTNIEEIFKLNEEFILKLGRMAFEYLNESKIIFTASDLKKYGIDIDKAGIHCGLCTEIVKEERVLIKNKFYCFVHLTVQEYFAALFVYHSFASKKIDSPSLKNFLLIGSEEELKATLDADPVDLPLDELMEIAIANSTLRKRGELDIFLRFLIGMSLQSTQELLQGLIQQTEEHSAVVEEVKRSLIGIDVIDCSPERCLNLAHCLFELKDTSLHDTVQQYVRPNQGPEKQLSPFQCSALADSILMSNTPVEDFNLKKYKPSTKGIFRLFPAVRNSRKVRISGVDLNNWLCETIYSALQMPNSVLTELHLTNNSFYQEGPDIITDSLINCQSKLEALSLSGENFWITDFEKLVSAFKSLPYLTDLELSDNIFGGSLCSLLSDVLHHAKLKKLRLNRNLQTSEICKELVTYLISNPCPLKELELGYAKFNDSEMEILSAGLMNTNCTLEVLSLSHNKLTEKGCQTLASVLSSKPSHLRVVDLSHNDLQNSGVMALCNALMNQHCGLKTLRLSFCKVSLDGCVSLASALRSDHCSLRELDLSFNHLTDRGVKLLTEIKRDSRYSLEELNVDQNEEYWLDFKLLKQYACDLTLDPNTASVHLILTEENKKATCVADKQPYPDHPDRFEGVQVLCEEGLTGRHYWEVECHSTDVGVAYKSIDRVADCSNETSFGENEKSWCWFYKGSFSHNHSSLKFFDCNTSNSTIGVYLDWPAGILSFFEVFPETMTHLHTVCTTFTEPLHPGFAAELILTHYCKIKSPKSL